MPACDLSWKNCKGFWGCVSGGVKSLGSCTESATGDAIHAANQEARTRAYNQTICLWNKWVKKEIDEYALLGSPQYPSGFALILKKRPDLFDKIKKRTVLDSDLQEALHECGQAFGNDWILKVANLTATGICTFLGGPAVGAAWAAAVEATKKIAMASQDCLGVSAKDAAIAVVGAGAAFYGANADGAGVDKDIAQKISKIASKGGSVDDIIQTIETYTGVTVPDEVKSILTCLASKMGTDGLAVAAYNAVSGDADVAIKSIAPYAVECGILEAANALPAGPLSDVLKKAAGVTKVVVKVALSDSGKGAIVSDQQKCNNSGGIWLDKTQNCIEAKNFFWAADNAKPSVKTVVDINLGIQKAKEEEDKAQKQQKTAKDAQNKQMLLLAAVAVGALLIAKG